MNNYLNSHVRSDEKKEREREEKMKWKRNLVRESGVETKWEILSSPQTKVKRGTDTVS